MINSVFWVKFTLFTPYPLTPNFGDIIKQKLHERIEAKMANSLYSPKEPAISFPAGS